LIMAELGNTRVLRTCGIFLASTTRIALRCFRATLAEFSTVTAGGSPP
jgi:hypothetical protein